MKNKAKYLASVSLAVLAAGYIMCLFFRGALWANILESGFEAGLVGGLADWFAVTALFRHPLGIPIPHTALLPKNRVKLTNALVSSFENNLLSKSSIIDKLSSFRIAEYLIKAANRFAREEDFYAKCAAFLSKRLAEADFSALAAFIKKHAVHFAAKVDARPILGKVSSVVIENKFDEKALDLVLAAAKQWVSKESSAAQIGRLASASIKRMENKGILQFATKSLINLTSDEKLGKTLQDIIMSNIQSLLKPENENRAAVLAKLKGALGELPENEKIAAELNALMLSLLNAPSLESDIIGFLEKIKLKAFSALSTAETRDKYFLPLLDAFFSRLEKQETQSLMDDWIKAKLAALIEVNYGKLTKLAKDNLDKLETKTLVALMEKNIGKDIQWIRVNGAVCGFAIGLAFGGIHTLFI